MLIHERVLEEQTHQLRTSIRILLPTKQFIKIFSDTPFLNSPSSAPFVSCISYFKWRLKFSLAIYCQTNNKSCSL
jgi:hypothetical protein